MAIWAHWAIGRPRQPRGQRDLASLGLKMPRLRLCLSWLAMLSLTACPSPTQVTTTGGAFIERSGGDFLVIYPEDECLTSALADQLKGTVSIYPTRGFQDAMFPWFERQHAPRTLDDLRALMARPRVAERVANIHVRYLISVAATQTSDVFPGLLCGAGYAGAGCLGLMLDNKETSLKALIWDLRDVSETGKLTSTSSGSSAALGIIVPIVFTAYTEEEACRALAKSIARSFN